MELTSTIESERTRACEGLTCVVADDHPVVCEAISAVLSAHAIEVVGTARHGESALAEIERERPLLALVDLGLPGISGAEVARRAQRVSPETQVIVYTGRAELAALTEALDAGARGFLLKDAPLPDVVRAIEMVANGGLYVDPGLASLLLDSSARKSELLTSREREVLRLASEGLGNDQIGERLFISPQTVRTHIGKAMAKLEAGTRTQAVALALRQKLIA
jgi:DNA-binding NarL/FixJ family response regulator